MKFFVQCVIIGVLAIIADILCTLHLIYFLKPDIAFAVITVVAIHVVSFFYTKWFIEYKETWRQVMITLAGAIGAGIGCFLVMLLEIK